MTCWLINALFSSHYSVSAKDQKTPSTRKSGSACWAACEAKMSGVNGYVLIYLVSVLSACTAGALNFSLPDGNSSESLNRADGGAVPMVLTTISQIIAREGNCVLIDCNVTGDPFPSVQWFNSHGHVLDTEGSGKL